MNQIDVIRRLELKTEDEVDGTVLVAWRQTGGGSGQMYQERILRIFGS